MRKVIASLYMATVLVGLVLVVLTLASPIGKALLFSGFGHNIAWVILGLAVFIFATT
jgi:ABC-type transport system involved in multi-copper enzyme maturation permease subunit